MFFVLTAVTYALLVLGSTVRVNGAGLACPDWPLCFGQIIPPINFQIGLEFGHRTLAGFVSVAFVGLCILVVKDAALRPRFGKALAFGLVLLATQVVLGGLTVLKLLAEWTVSSHLMAGNTFCLTLLLLSLALAEADVRPMRPALTAPLRVGAVAFFGLVFVQLGLGGFVSSSGAGLACSSWPACNGALWFPSFSGLVGLQVFHRLLAYLLLSCAVGLAWLCMGHVRLRNKALLLMGLLLLQVTLGVANVFLAVPVEVTLLHSATAAAIVLTTGWLNFEVWRAPLAPKMEAL